MSSESQCPFSATTQSGRSNRDWWPNQLNLNALHTNHPAGDPMGSQFNYAEEFKTLDLDAVKKDIAAVMTNSQRLVARRLRPLRAALHPHGVAQLPARTASTTAAAARARGSCASRPSAAGPTTQTSTRRAGCSGRSNRSTVGRSRGPT